MDGNTVHSLESSGITVHEQLGFIDNEQQLELNCGNGRQPELSGTTVYQQFKVTESEQQLKLSGNTDHLLSGKTCYACFFFTCFMKLVCHFFVSAEENTLNSYSQWLYDFHWCNSLETCLVSAGSTPFNDILD